MTTNVIMPVLGMLQDTGRIVRWLKKTGDPVKKGETLLEVETDKAVQELEAPASGILAQVLAGDDDEVPVTHIIAVIASPEEFQSGSIARLVTPAQAEPEIKIQQVENTSQNSAPITPSSPKALFGKILVSPKARRLAREANLDLAILRGSGPDGAILAQDVESYAPPVVVQPAHSMHTAANFTLHRRLDLTHFLSWFELAKRNKLTEISMVDLLVKVAARTLTGYPQLDAAWKDGSFTLRDLSQFGVDAYDPALGGGQAAVLGIGRVTDQVIPFHGLPAIRPTLTLSLACDSRLVEETTAARFLETLADLLEEPFLLLS